ncbi:MAG: phosphatidylserine/phosphatidylglycerophosphate/cardiolipin synthase family protein [Candidatus Sericytochromatia bacterium]|nr:phosphatidylserine/phosphatidylglycerophosphate/cardiolipin synthase family protein [Candidatus Sericytochromatia bacterium]
MRSRASRIVLSALLATLGTGCSRVGALGPLAQARGGGDGRVEALAHREAADQIEAELTSGGLNREQAGFEPGVFAALDRNGDGRLDRQEQLAGFSEVWQAMRALGEARRPQHASKREAPVSPAQEYRVPHPTTYGATEAEVFVDAGEIMPAVFHTLQNASRSIWLDVFLLGGTEGRKLADLLVQKHLEGVDVRLIHDPGYGLAGAANAQIVPVMRHLLANGVPLRSYPLAYMPRRKGHPLANRFQIDHNKMVIVDGTTAMIGTMNLIDLGVMNHDVYLKVTGSAAEELAAIHAATWGLRGSRPPLFPPLPSPPPTLVPPPARDLGFGLLQVPGGEVARVTKTDIDVQDTRRVLLEAIAQARHSVRVAIFEFGDVNVARALVAAYKRGVDVQVLCDRNANYHKYLDAFKRLKLHGTPNLVTANLLRDAGVPVKWYVPQLEDQELHMKLAIVDGERALVGSTNFTYQAFSTFRETNLDLVSPRVAGKLEAMFARDWEHRGAPVTRPTFFERSVMAAVRAFDRFNLSWW